MSPAVGGDSAGRRIRVALVIGQLHAGGSERQLYELATRLPGGPCVPLVYCLSQVVDPFGGMLESAGVTLRVFPRRRSYEPGRVRSLSRRLASDSIDIVHSLAPSPNLYSYLADWISGPRILVTSNRAVDDTCGWISARISGWVYRRSECVVANSEAVRAFTRGFYRVPDDRIVVIPNGVDFGRFENLSDPALTRSKLGIPPGAPLVGLVGRLSREKEGGLFLDAARIVASELPEARFLIVGNGPMESDLRRQAGEAGLETRVTFTGMRTDVPDILSALDLLALTSSQEGMPNAVLEAMAAGRPVVATKVGGCPELVDEGVTGYLVPFGDPAFLARRILEVLTRPDRGLSLGEEGRRRARSEFSLQAVVDRSQALYVRLAARRGFTVSGNRR